MPDKLFIRKFTEIKNNKGFLKYLKNTTWLLVEKCIRIISVVFIGAWIARYLGPDKYGLLAYSISIISVFMPLANLGLNDVLVKELLKKEVSKNEILGTSFISRLISGSLIFILILVFTILFNVDDTTKYLILVLSLNLIIQSFDVLDLFFQSEVKSRFAVYSRIIALILSNLIKVFLIVNEFSLIYFASIIIIEFSFVILIYIYYYNYSFEQRITKWKFKINIAIHFVKSSWPLILSGLMFVFYLRIDQIMVKEILGNKSGGIYAVAMNLSEVWYFLPQIITSSLFPMIISSKNRSSELYHSRLIKLYSLMFWLSISIALFITFFGGTIINILYGSDYSESFLILKIYIWSNVFYFFTTVSSKWLIAEDFFIYSFYRNFFGAILNFLLNFLLLKHLGVIGAAISTLISYLFVGLLFDLFVKKLRINFFLKVKSIFSFY